MDIITIDGKEYEARVTNDVVLLEDALKIHKLDIPKKLKKYYDFTAGKTKKEIKFSDHDRTIHIPTYCKQVMKILTNIPKKIINGLTPEECFQLYTECFDGIIFTTLYEGFGSDVGNLESFTLDGVEYFLPLSKDVMGKERPMYKEAFIVWAEQDDILKAMAQISNGHLEVAKHIISIMARPIDPETKEVEEYDEARSLDRADIFLKTPMYVLWEIFFCTVRLRNMSLLSSRLKVETKAKNSVTHPMQAV